MTEVISSRPHPALIQGGMGIATSESVLRICRLTPSPALRVIGADPIEALVIPRLLALMIALPLLSYLPSLVLHTIGEHFSFRE